MPAVGVTQSGANQQITQTSTPFVSEDWWRGECLFAVIRGLKNAQIFPYNRSRVRKSGIEGNNEWYSVCVVILLSWFQSFVTWDAADALISFVRKDIL